MRYLQHAASAGTMVPFDIRKMFVRRRFRLDERVHLREGTLDCGGWAASVLPYPRLSAGQAASKASERRNHLQEDRERLSGVRSLECWLRRP